MIQRRAYTMYLHKHCMYANGTNFNPADVCIMNRCCVGGIRIHIDMYAYMSLCVCLSLSLSIYTLYYYIYICIYIYIYTYTYTYTHTYAHACMYSCVWCCMLHFQLARRRNGHIIVTEAEITKYDTRSVWTLLWGIAHATHLVHIIAHITLLPTNMPTDMTSWSEQRMLHTWNTEV